MQDFPLCFNVALYRGLDAVQKRGLDVNLVQGDPWVKGVVQSLWKRAEAEIPEEHIWDDFDPLLECDAQGIFYDAVVPIIYNILKGHERALAARQLFGRGLSNWNERRQAVTAALNVLEGKEPEMALTEAQKAYVSAFVDVVRAQAS